MKRLLLGGLVALWGTVGVLAAAAEPALPEPWYLPVPEDPAWLKTTVQFHGHLGPWVVIGARFGMGGLQAVDAKGYFDVEVTCAGPFDKPPRACFLDGLQIGAGTTLGKRTLSYTPAEQIVVRFKNTTTGKTAELRPTTKLLEMLGAMQTRLMTDAAKEENHSHGGRAPVAVEKVARRAAHLPDADIFSVTPGK